MRIKGKNPWYKNSEWWNVRRTNSSIQISWCSHLGPWLLQETFSVPLQFDMLSPFIFTLQNWTRAIFFSYPFLSMAFWWGKTSDKRKVLKNVDCNEGKKGFVTHFGSNLPRGWYSLFHSLPAVLYYITSSFVLSSVCNGDGYKRELKLMAISNQFWALMEIRLFAGHAAVSCNWLIAAIPNRDNLINTIH